MADSIWGTDRPLGESLFEEPWEFEFFQAVRLLALMELERRAAAGMEAAEHPVQFAVHNSMSFPPSPVVSITSEGADKPPKMTVALLGLIGPGGALPQFYTEIAVHQAVSDPSFAAFFDLFHNRLISLYYRAWEKHHFFVGYERATRGGSPPDALSGYLLHLMGMSNAGLKNRLAFPDQALLRYAGLLLQRPRSAECLRALLHDFFSLPVKVEQFIGRWHCLEEEELCVLGSGDANSRLGRGSIAGDMAWTRQSVVRIVFGPLTAYEFFQFLPDSETFHVASDLIRWYLGSVNDFELQPILGRGQTPGWCRLGESRGSARLGWSHWLTDEPFEHPATDAVFQEREVFRMEV